MSETKKRKVHTPEFNAKVGLEALRGVKTINQFGQDYDVHTPRCRFAHQPCFVAEKYQLTEHCAKWYKTFPDASQCDQYEREPGSDDDT